MDAIEYPEEFRRYEAEIKRRRAESEAVMDELIELAGGEEEAVRFGFAVCRAAVAAALAIRLVHSEEDQEIMERIRRNIAARRTGTMGVKLTTEGDQP